MDIIVPRKDHDLFHEKNKDLIDIWKHHNEYKARTNEKDLQETSLRCDICRKILRFWVPALKKSSCYVSSSDGDEPQSEEKQKNRDENEQQQQETKKRKMKETIETKEKGFYKSTNFYTMDLCETCFNDPQCDALSIQNWNHNEQPHECEICKQKKDGTLGRYTISGNEFIDFCAVCMVSGAATKFIKDNMIFVPFDIQKTGDFEVSSRTNTCFVNVRKNEKGYEIPLQLSMLFENQKEGDEECQLEKITAETNREYLDSFQEIVHTNLKDSHLNWTVFSKESDQYHFQTCLLVNCVKGESHAVASMLFDNHGRISIDLLYDSFDEFWREYQEWESLKELKSISKKNEQEKEEEEEEDEKEEIEYFSDHVRIIHKMECYYG